MTQIETGETKNIMIKTGIMDLKQDPENYVVEPIVNYTFYLPTHGSSFKFLD